MKKNKQLFAPVWRHWKHAFAAYRFWVIGTFVFYGVAYYLEDVYKATLWQKIVDALQRHENPFILFLYILIVGIAMWICNRLADYCNVHLESNILRSLKNYSLRHLLAYDTNYFLNMFTGSIVAKARKFAAASEIVYDNIIFRILRVCIILPGVFFAVVRIVPMIGYVLLVWSAIFSFVAWYFAVKRAPYNRASAEADSHTTGHFTDIVGSVQMVQSYVRESIEYDNFEIVTYEDHQKRYTKWIQKNHQVALQSILTLLLEVVLMYIVISQCLDGRVSVGIVVLVQSYIVGVTRNMWELSRSIADVQVALADANEMAVSLSEKIDSKLEEKVPPYTGDQIHSFEIQFDNVRFSYPGRSIDVLKGISFHIESGKRYGIVGSTGSGKTSMTRLLLRQFDISEECGDIRIGGVSIYDIPVYDLRRLISYVPQDPHFPFRSIRDIIAFGNEDATDEQIIEASRNASCHNFIIEDLEYGYDTMIGEKGVKLSGGQRQRLAIAAAFLKDAPIVILDEPTSALDSETEEAIQNVLRSMKNKTMIVIAHRLTTVSGLDEIIVLKNGTVEEQGSHSFLLNKDGAYASFWKKQFHL